MSRQGIEVAQSGHDLGNRGDVDLLIGSEWPPIRILHQDRYQEILTPPYTNLHPVIYHHGLGYPPLTYFFDESAEVAGGMHPGVAAVERSLIGIDDQNIYWFSPGFGGGGPASIPIDVTFIVCPIDISKNFVAPEINVGASERTKPSKHGIKIVRSGKKIDSSDIRDYVLHSETRSPNIHSITAGNLDGTGRTTVRYTLPYDPMFLAYTQTTIDELGPVYTLLNGFSGITNSEGQISILGEQNGIYSVVILKDPFVINEPPLKVTI